MRNLFAVSLPFLDEFAIMYLLRWQVWKIQKVSRRNGNGSA